MNLKSIARALGGDVTGNQVVAPGPGHSRHDRSMAVFIDGANLDGFRVHSFAGDDWQACRDHVKARLGIPSGPSAWPFVPLVAPAPKPEKNDSDRIDRVLSIWSESVPLKGTPALVYLRNRGIDLQKLPEGIGEAMRWHPSCPWEGGRHGAMIALMTDAVTGEPRAIHRTALTPHGQKVDKKMLGPSGSCVVRLWADETVTKGLVLGEGIETTLAAATRLDHKGTALIPAWAACSAVGMAKFPVLPGIETLTLLVDNDVSGAGQRAAMECAGRWTMADKEVITLMPSNEGQDFADVTADMARGAA